VTTTTGSSLTGTTWRRDDQGSHGWVLRRRDSLSRAVAVARIMDDLEDDVEVLAGPSHGWQDFLQRLAHGLRRAAAGRPEAVPGLLSRPRDGSRLLPPLASASWTERFLVALTAEGFGDDQAVGAYRAFTTFMAGHLWMGLPSGGTLSGRTTGVRTHATAPALPRAQEPSCETTSMVEFEDGLEQLLDRLAMLPLTARRGGSRIGRPAAAAAAG
jgi:hypothetical protein